MQDLVRTNDPVLIGFVEALLGDAGIECLVADGAISTMEGSIGFFPRRVLVREEDHAQASDVLRDAGLGAELFR